MGFPLNSNDPYIKSTGERTTLGAAVSSGGGGEPYTLPTASAETKGGIKIGSGLTMTGEVLSNNNPTPYSLPTASAETLGGVKVGSGLSIADGVLSAAASGGAHIFKITSTNAAFKEAYLIGTYAETPTTSGDILNYFANSSGKAFGVIVNGSGTGQFFTGFTKQNNYNFYLTGYSFAVDNSAVTVTPFNNESFNKDSLTGLSVTKIS